jgi:hypothetical protein
VKICFPARKASGKDYSTLDEMMDVLSHEPHGTWLAGTNLLWHGGIHLSETTSPASVLTADNADSAIPVQCMAGGEVVAWRVNRDYLTNHYAGHTLQYSSTLVLVKSPCQPDPQNAQSGMDFYMLYMGLAPLSAFEKHRCLRVTEPDGVRMHPVEKYDASEPDGVTVILSRSAGTLAKGARVLLLKEGLYTYKHQDNQPFGLARRLDKHGAATGEPFWVTTSDAYMSADGEQYGHMPAWMQQAVAKGAFDCVMQPDPPLTISAGDAIGFLGRDTDSTGGGNADSSCFVHIEVLSADPSMPDFLANPGHVTSGEKYLRIEAGKTLYQKRGDGAAAAFVPMSCVIVKDSGKILPANACATVQAQGKAWYEISPGNWMCQDDVTVLNQFDLKGRGFCALEQGPTPDMAASLAEDWTKQVLGEISRQVNPERGLQEKQVAAYYQKAITRIDADGDGKLSAQELFNAFTHPEMGVCDIVARMVVRHESEWFGNSSHPKWVEYYKTYDRPLMAYSKKWQDDMSWMEHVAPFSSGEPVWHMHPVMFLDAIAAKIKLWELGTTSEHYESGGRGPGVISSGKGDHGGASYGCYQLSSKLGVVQDYIKQSKYKSRFDGLQIGTQEFNSEWKRIASEDKNGFSHDQYLFIKKTHYEAQLGFLAKHGISIKHKRAAIHDMIWSTSVQYGPYTNLIVKAVAGLSLDSATDVQIITAVQDYKHDSVETKFHSSPTLWPGLKARAISEKAKLLKLENDNYEVE